MDVLKLLHYYSKLPSDINAPQREASPPMAFTQFTEWLPLKEACANQQVQAVEFLLQTYEDIDLNAKVRGASDPILLVVCMQDMNEAGADLLKLLLHYSDQRNLGINVNVKDYGGNNAVYTAYPDYEKMEILINRGVSLFEISTRGYDCYTKDWNASSQRFLQILNVTEKLTSLQMLNLFTEKLDLLMNAIPKVERRYCSYGRFVEDRVNMALPQYGVGDGHLDAEERDRLA